MDSKTVNIVRICTIAGILLLGIYVALKPDLVYAPTPKVVLYLLISFLPALLIGAEASTRFEFKLPGFVFTTAGACAVCFGSLILLTKLTKPEQQIAVYHIIDEEDQPITLEYEGAVDIETTSNGLKPVKFVDGNTIIIIFPEQVGKVKLKVRKSDISHLYSGEVNYAGDRMTDLKIGRDLK